MTVSEILAQARARYAELEGLGEYSVQAKHTLELYRLLVALCEALEADRPLTLDDVLAKLTNAQPPVVNADDKPTKTKR